jgi:hypothetical protein
MFNYFSRNVAYPTVVQYTRVQYVKELTTPVGHVAKVLPGPGKTIKF